MVKRLVELRSTIRVMEGKLLFFFIMKDPNKIFCTEFTPAFGLFNTLRSAVNTEKIKNWVKEYVQNVMPIVYIHDLDNGDGIYYCVFPNGLCIGGIDTSRYGAVTAYNWIGSKLKPRYFSQEIITADNTEQSAQVTALYEQFKDRFGNWIDGVVAVESTGLVPQYHSGGSGGNYLDFDTWFAKNYSQVKNAYEMTGGKLVGVQMVGKSYDGVEWSHLPDMYMSYIDNLGTLVLNNYYLSPGRTTSLYTTTKWGLSNAKPRRWVIVSYDTLGQSIQMQYVNELADMVPYIRLDQLEDLMMYLFPRYYAFGRMDALNSEFPTYRKLLYDVENIRKEVGWEGLFELPRDHYQMVIARLNASGLMHGIKMVDAPEHWRPEIDEDDGFLPEEWSDLEHALTNPGDNDGTLFGGWGGFW